MEPTHASIRQWAQRLGFLVVAAITMSACQFGRTTSMAAENRTDEDAVIRLVLVGGGFRDFALPQHSIVLLDMSLDVDRAVMFDPSCREMGTSVCGKGNTSYRDGGQLYLAPPNQTGMTTELSPVAAPFAEPSRTCLQVPTPVDPRLRPPTNGGGAR